MVSTRDLSRLPDVQGLRLLLQAMTTLSLNPRLSLEALAADLDEIGYPSLTASR